MRARPLLLLVPLLLVLAGCTSNPDEVGRSSLDQAALDEALAATTARIEPIPGVTDVTTNAELSGDLSYQVSVTVLAGELEETGTVAVIAALVDGLGSSVFDEQQVYASIVSDTQSLSMSTFALSGADIRSEVAYWYDFADALGAPVALQLDATPDNHRRTLTATALQGDVPWEALAEVVDSSTALHAWSLPGVEAYGVLPDADAIALIRSLDAIVPPADYGVTDFAGYTLSIEQGAPSLTVSSLSLEGVAPASSADWGWFTAAVSTAVASGAGVGNVSYLSSATSAGGVVHLGACAGTVTASEDDDVLLAALAAAGVALPADSGAGYCAVTPQ